MKKTLMLLAVLALLATPAVARDHGPLDGWDRAADYSTFAHWEFSTNQLPCYPEEYTNPFGDEPFAEFPTGGWDWSDGWPCPPVIGDPTGSGSGTCTGWHCTSLEGGKITLTIANNEEPNEYKRIFLQITSSKQPTGVSTTGSGGATGGYTSGTFPTGRPDVQEGTPAPPFPGSSWYTYNYGLTIRPNPESETITIEVPYCTVIDQIVVDTECIPEPATMSLLVLGGIGVLVRRRRK